MSDDELKRLEVLPAEVSFLRKLVFFQRAQIEALGAFVSAHIADLSGVDRAQAAEDLQAMVRKKYDEIILKLGDKYPAVAKDADIRDHVKPDDLDKWLFP